MMNNHPIQSQERRRDQRAGLELPVKISIGSQITVSGRLKDLSLSSAFIKIRNKCIFKAFEQI